MTLVQIVGELHFRFQLVLK